MVTCEFCQATHPDNTIFCDECGNYLLEKNNQETDPLDLEVRGQIGHSANTLNLPQAVVNERGPILIRLLIEQGLRVIELALDKPVYLGRVDPLSDTFPEIDLSEVGGIEKGVSRRHARLLERESSVIIEDLGSINGTYINRQRLSAYTAEVLNDGDFVHLGQLIFQIRFEQIPPL